MKQVPAESGAERLPQGTSDRPGEPGPAVAAAPKLSPGGLPRGMRMSAANVIALQRAAGNGATSRLLRPKVIQRDASMDAILTEFDPLHEDTSDPGGGTEPAPSTPTPGGGGASMEEILAEFDPLYEPSASSSPTTPAPGTPAPGTPAPGQAGPGMRPGYANLLGLPPSQIPASARLANTTNRLGATSGLDSVVEGGKVGAGLFGMGDLGAEIRTGKTISEHASGPAAKLGGAVAGMVPGSVGSINLPSIPTPAIAARDEVSSSGGVLAGAMESLSEAGKNADSPVVQGAGEALGGFATAFGKLETFVSGVLSAMGGPIIKVLAAVLGARDAYGQWKAFSGVAESSVTGQAPAEDAFGNQEESTSNSSSRVGRMLDRFRGKGGRDTQSLLKTTRSQTGEVAQYAASKRFRGFVQSAFSAAMAVGRLVGEILVALGGTGAIVSFAARLVEASRSGLNWAKGLYKMVKGTRGVHRTASSNELIEVARDNSHEDNDAALQLILDLDIFGVTWKATLGAGAAKKRLGMSEIQMLTAAPKSKDDLRVLILTLERHDMLASLGDALRGTMKSTS